MRTLPLDRLCVRPMCLAKCSIIAVAAQSALAGFLLQNEFFSHTPVSAVSAVGENPITSLRLTNFLNKSQERASRCGT